MNDVIRNEQSLAARNATYDAAFNLFLHVKTTAVPAEALDNLIARACMVVEGTYEVIGPNLPDWRDGPRCSFLLPPLRHRVADQIMKFFVTSALPADEMESLLYDALNAAVERRKETAHLYKRQAPRRRPKPKELR